MSIFIKSKRYEEKYFDGNYQYVQNQIKKGDKEIERMLSNRINSDDHKHEHYIDKKVHKRLNKNAPYRNDHVYKFLDQKMFCADF